MEANDNLEKDGGEGKKQGGVEELESNQSSGTEQGVLVGKLDDHMRLVARRDMMMIIKHFETAPENFFMWFCLPFRKASF